MKSHKEKTTYAILSTGPNIVQWVFENYVEWCPETEFGIRREELSCHYWQSQRCKDLTEKEIEKLEKEEVTVCQVVNGRLFEEQMEVVILPSKTGFKRYAVDIDKLG